MQDVKTKDIWIIW